MDQVGLVRLAAGGDVRAFVELTQRFQHFAFGAALALLHDFQQAEDVVQEALLAAWSGLPTLAHPEAFPGWLRGIVRFLAFEYPRRVGAELAVPLDLIGTIAHKPTLKDEFPEGVDCGKFLACRQGDDLIAIIGKQRICQSNEGVRLVSSKGRESRFDLLFAVSFGDVKFSSDRPRCGERKHCSEDPDRHQPQGATSIRPGCRSWLR
jgi:hypothetical protein